MKNYLLTIVSLILSIGCFVTYNIIGSKLSADGTLIEPFYLIPIGFIFLEISIIGLVISLIKFRKKKIKSKMIMHNIV